MNVFIAIALAAIVAAAPSQVDLIVTNGQLVFYANVSVGGSSVTTFAQSTPFTGRVNGTDELFRGLTALPGAGDSSRPYLALSSGGNFYTTDGQGQASFLFKPTCAGLVKPNTALSMDVNPTNGLVAVFTIIPGVGEAADAETNLFYVNLTSETCAPQQKVVYPSSDASVKSLGIAYGYNSFTGVATLYLSSVDPLTGSVDLYVVPPQGGQLAFVGSSGLVTNSAIGGLAVYYNYTGDGTARGILVAVNASGNGDSTVASVDLTNGTATTISTLPSEINPFAFAILGNDFPPNATFFAPTTIRNYTVNPGVTLQVSTPSAGATSAAATVLIENGGVTSSLPATVLLAGNGQYNRQIVAEVAGSQAEAQATVLGTTQKFTASFAAGTAATATITVTAPAAQSTTTVQLDDAIGTALLGAIDRAILPPTIIRTDVSAGQDIDFTAGDASRPTVTSAQKLSYAAAYKLADTQVTGGGNPTGNGENKPTTGSAGVLCASVAFSVAVAVLLA